MSFTADSPLVDKVLVAEAYDRQGAPILAVVIHMAEGGGTDTWLTRIDGNSSHYVVKYNGTLVQLVPESKAAGSMNPRATRTTDDAPFTIDGETVRYGRTALDAVLGAYAPIKVNRPVIAIEVEGFAKYGPNIAQTFTLTALIADIRKRRGPIGLLGHRDQQAYKACPGKKIPWAALGGHGPTTTEDDVPLIDFTLASDEVAGTIKVKEFGATVVTIDGGDRPTLPAGMQRPAMGPVYLGIRGDEPHYLVFIGTKEIGFVLGSDVTFAAFGVDDCQAEVDAAVAATKASARVAFD